MKKFLIILITGILWCNVGFSKAMLFKDCKSVKLEMYGENDEDKITLENNIIEPRWELAIFPEKKLAIEAIAHDDGTVEKNKIYISHSENEILYGYDFLSKTLIEEYEINLKDFSFKKNTIDYKATEEQIKRMPKNEDIQNALKLGEKVNGAGPFVWTQKCVEGELNLN